MAEDTSWFNSEEWQAKEREADEDFANGRFDIVNTIDELSKLFHKKEKEIKRGINNG